MVKQCGSVLAVLMCGGIASAQSINLEWGTPETAPPSTYAGVGLPGVWNTLQEMPSGTRFPLVDIDGNVVTADVANFGFDVIESSEIPGTFGADEALLDDCYTSFNDPVDGCLFFKEMEPGEYEVIMYSIAPDDTTLTSRIRVDQNTLDPEFIGGEWAGLHQDGVTYLRQSATVTGDGRLEIHSGLFGGEIRSVLNGVQLIKTSEVCTGDCDSDGEVAFNDLICALFTFGTPSFTADCDGNESVDFNDLVCMLFEFGPCE